MKELLKKLLRSLTSSLLNGLAVLVILIGILLLTNYHNLGSLLKVVLLVETQYYDDVDSGELIEEAARGSVAGLGDKYSYYLDEKTYPLVIDNLAGSFVGIGVGIDEREGKFVFTTVYKDMPAYKAGIRQDDILLAIDGKEVPEDIDTELLAGMLRGEQGSSVDLTMYRSSTDEELKYTVYRDKISIPTVDYKIMADGMVGYISISEFTDKTVQDFNNAMDQLTKAKVRGLVIDVRDNPGGSLDSVHKISDRFLKEGPIVTLESRNGAQKTYYADEDATDLPMAVLINGSSASASEIFAGAMQDTERAVLLGTKTYGKGIVQSIYSVSEDAGLKLTTARYITPNGNYVHEVGITPDIIVEENNGSDEDFQLSRAVEVVQQEIMKQ